MTTRSASRDRGLRLAAVGLALALVFSLWHAWTPPAHADMVTQRGEYVALTTKANNAELLAVIDTRDEVLLIYQVEAQSKFQLFARESLPDLFSAARGQAGR